MPMRRSTYCDRCRREVESAAVEITESVGLLFAVSFRTNRGYFCRECTRAVFWRAAGVNLTAGLLWPLGLVAGPLLTLSSWFSLLDSKRLAPVGSAQQPEIDEAIARAVEALIPRLAEHIEMQTGDLHESAGALAASAGLRPAQVIHATRSMAEAASPPAEGRGFEVILRNQPVLAEPVGRMRCNTGATRGS